jgi:rare lipoprotein A
MKEAAMNALGRAKQRRIVAILVTLATVSMMGIAAGQKGEEGVANFYSDKFQGKKTASGEVYDKNGLTASHKKLPTEPK